MVQPAAVQPNDPALRGSPTASRRRGRARVRVVAAGLALTGLGVAGLGVAVPTPAGALVNASAMANPVLTGPALNLAGDPSGNGTWAVAANGQVVATGSAELHGNATTERSGALVTGIAPTPTGAGYWIASHTGGVFTHGDARFFGSAGGQQLTAPVVDIEATPTGKGYLLITSDGKVLRFGDAKLYGVPAQLTRGPIVDAAITPTGKGYWLVSSGGGVYHFGDARWYGSATGKTNTDVTGIARTATGRGYLLSNSGGGLFNFGDAPYYGSLTNKCSGNPITGLATSDATRGYWMVVSTGRTFAFSPTSRPTGCGPSGSSKAARAASDLFSRLNAERTARGLPALRWDDTLAAESAGWSAEMDRSGFRHSNLQRLLSDGRFNLVAENIAWARGGSVTAATLHVAWMDSDGHRRNMLSPNLQAVGIGVYCGADGTMWATQEFGRYASSGAAPTASTPPRNPVTRSDPGTATC